MNASIKKAKRFLFTLTLVALTILTLSPILIPLKIVKAATPIVKMNPSYATIGQEGQQIPTTQPATISIEVENVADLFLWQVVIYYDNNTLYTQTNWMWLPSNHVFSGKGFNPMGPSAGSDVYGHYIMMSVALQGGEPTFTGNGILCKINFTAVGVAGISFLNFTTPIGSKVGTYETYMWDSWLDEIPATSIEGAVEVKGTTTPPKEPSIITLTADKTLVHLGDNVTLSGNVTTQDGTPKPNVEVNVKYGMQETSLDILKTVKTDTEGRYNCTWTPTEFDIPEGKSQDYTFQATWLGDETHSGNQSEKITIKLEKVAYINIEAPTTVPDLLRIPDLTLQSDIDKFPNITQPFLVNITVTDVTNLFSWQIKLTYEPQYLEFLNLTLPTSHIFQNQNFTWNWINSTAEGYVLANATLNVGEQSFNGSGTLFQITFRGIKLTRLGTKLLPVRDESFLKNATGYSIPAEYRTKYGTTWVAPEIFLLYIYVYEAPKVKLGSSIVIELNATKILIGENVTITGELALEDGTPIPNVTITIRYKSWDFAYRKLVDVKLDENGAFSHIFFGPQEPNEYTFKAYWRGDENITDAYSEEVTLVVTEKGAAGFDVFFYAVVSAVALIGLANVSVTIVYFRKMKGQVKPEL